MAPNDRQNFFIFTDYGSEPLAVNVARAATLNTNYRTTLWTGSHLQMTLMQINSGEDIGLEVHTDTDQYIMVIDGTAVVAMRSEEHTSELQSP